MKRHSCISLRGFCLPHDELLPPGKQLSPHSLSSFIYLGKACQKMTTGTIQKYDDRGKMTVAIGGDSNVYLQQGFRTHIHLSKRTHTETSLFSNM